MFDIESQIFVSEKDKYFSSQEGVVWTALYRIIKNTYC